MRVAFILSVAAGFAFGLVAGAANIVGRGLPVLQQPTSVIWSNRVFTSRHQLAVWLEARGSNYSVWATRHPDLARPFEIRFREPMATPSPAQPAEVTERRADHGRSGMLLIIGSISLAAVLGTSALMLFRRFGPYRLELAYAGRRIRTVNTVHTPRPPVRSMLRARARPKGEPQRSPSRPKVGQIVEPGPVRAAMSPLLSVSLSMPRLPHARSGAWRDWFGRLIKLGRAGGERSRVAVSAVSYRRFRRRTLPSIAFYASSGLLAFVLGAWIAIYLK